jgi:hypothetical protein
MSMQLPGPLNGVILDGVGVDGANHFGVVSRTDHHVTRYISDAEIEKKISFLHCQDFFTKVL